MEKDPSGDQWYVTLLRRRLPWASGPLLPADVGGWLRDIMLARDHLIEDANFRKVVPNRFIVELNEENYLHHYQPIEARILQQWRDRLLADLETANSRQGKRVYTFAGKVEVQIRSAAGLVANQARVLSQIRRGSAGEISPGGTSLPAWLEHSPTGQRWQLHQGVLTIGREAGNDITLDMPSVRERRLVSGQHATLRCDGKECWLFDGAPNGKASVNGTYVNSRRVPSGGHRLEDGDLILLAAVNPLEPSNDTPGVVELRFKKEISCLTFFAWNLILLASKWILIVLIYAVLLVILFSVRRELSLRLGSVQPREAVAVGRLRVVNPGGDVRLRPGLLLNLRADTHLGAAADNDVLLNSPFISGHHARLTWDGAAWWVEDLGSRNGTLAAGSPCPVGRPQPLPCGAPLQVGDITVELVEAE